MSISYQDFVEAATLFQQCWPGLCSEAASSTWWTVECHQGIFGGEGQLYLKLEAMPVHAAATQQNTEGSGAPDFGDISTDTGCWASTAAVDQGDIAEGAHTSDGAEVAASHVALGETHLYDLHIAYHPSYQVPVLYLRGKRQDGCPLSWEQMQRDFPAWAEHMASAAATTVGGDTWTFITQEPHVVLQQPWYMLHPCQTSQLLGLMLAAGVSTAAGGDTPGRDEGGGVPDIDDVGTGPVLPQGAQQPQQQQQLQGWAGLAANWDTQMGGQINAEGSAEQQQQRRLSLLRYMAAWFGVAGPVVGLHLRPGALSAELPC